MRASRLLTILITLQLHGRVSAGDLARQFKVSKRTIYRDMDELSASGVPVYADRGPLGGFALVDGFKTELTGLTHAETEALLMAGIPAVAADLGLATAATSARTKLLAAMPKKSRDAARRVSERFHVDLTDWYRRPRVSPYLQLLARAVWESRKINVRYESWSKVSNAVIDPLGLVMKGGRWYLLAQSGTKSRIYRLDKMIEVTVLEESFARPASYDLATRWNEMVATFEAGLRRQTARLRVQATALSRVELLGSDMAEPLLNAQPNADGSREATVPIESIGHAASVLLSFADNVRVIEPAELKEEIVSRAQKVVRMYRR